ncbi:MAG: hypothetical protein JWQ68_468 [Cryobacterium sp.]|jgi:hypothetical protein|nr:hypothetical protein [Cryobacterium sp.]
MTNPGFSEGNSLAPAVPPPSLAMSAPCGLVAQATGGAALIASEVC